MFAFGFAGVLWQWHRAERNALLEKNERRRAESFSTLLMARRAEDYFKGDDTPKGVAHLS